MKVVERFFTAINTANISDFNIKTLGELFDKEGGITNDRCTAD
ncbi:hypothetical protein APU01nite_17420 [Alkalibacterium putridalgicola]|uniref:Uncharacterized protein n=1 Tax=Alkalibacterium putridalgicola TaxID=426703 RepID=A0ABQ0V047_9LACT|nr:hypothetical protein APU01nite_17420 [Alkalibacterium putridalgicola]